MEKITGHLPDELAEEFYRLAQKKTFIKNEIIFNENDDADAIYFIDKGSFQASIIRNQNNKMLNIIHIGECFGEMALINHDKRSATITAIEDSVVYCVHKDDFAVLSESFPELDKGIRSSIANRQQELILREELVDITNINKESLQVSIKGDYSMRETSLYRERYDSLADKNLDKLITLTQDILLNRCAHQIDIHFNSGEIHTMSVFDPFREKIHLVDNFTNTAYIDRHFQEISYNEKANLISHLYETIAASSAFKKLPEHWQQIHRRSHKIWAPINYQVIKKIISYLPHLRNIESLYLRNVKISIIQDLIRFQFNCDGTHIVDSTNFDDFIKSNF
jgi:CRP-like cAMP-binding protein